MSDVFKALSHPGRRRILIALRRGPMTPSELSNALDMKMPNLSAQLNVLKKAGMVFAQRNGVSMAYELNASVIETALGALMTQLRVGEGAETDKDDGSPPPRTPVDGTNGQATERKEG